MGSTVFRGDLLFAYGKLIAYPSIRLLTITQTWEELQRISEDRSSITGRPYVPLSILHAAHWNQSILRNIINKPSSALPRAASPPDRKELGLAITTNELSQMKEPHHNLWPVPIDTSTRIGDPIVATTMEELFSNASTPRRNRPVTSASNFFGIESSRGNSARCREEDPSGASRWVPQEPFRFSVEFWNVDLLKEKVRLHSHTIWFAGSCYNIYIQAVRKKGLQLGVYLHRQSNVDLPPASVPRSLAAPPQSQAPSTPPIASPIPERAIAGPVSPSRSNNRSRAWSQPASELTNPLRSYIGASRSNLLRSSTPVTIPHSYSTVSVVHPSSPTTPVGSPSSPSGLLPGVSAQTSG